MYLYRINKLPSLEDKYLYHFTKAKNLISILRTMKLKFSTFKNLNDLNEKEVNFTFDDGIKEIKTNEYILKYCKLISFSQNFTRNTDICKCGCNHPRMWAQYADNNKGACIVLNENKLIEKNKTILNNLLFKIENVEYKPYIYNGNHTNDEQPESFIKNNYLKLFFQKHNDWSQEDERRIFCMDGPDFLDIDNCIEFICLGNKFQEEDYNKLSKIIISNMKRKYKILIPHDFTIQVNVDGECKTWDDASKIIKLVKEKGSIANKYLDYLNTIGYTEKLI